MSNLNFTDNLHTPIRGEFTIKVKDRNGNVVYTHQDLNLVVTQSKTILALLLAGDTTKAVTKIAFGQDSMSPAPDNETISGVQTISLAVGNNISGPDIVALVKSLDGAVHSALGQVIFQWSLDYEEANGLNISEFGLLSTDQHLFARKTRGAILKQSDLAMEGSWKIIF